MSQTKAKVNTRPGFLKEDAEGVEEGSSFTKYHNIKDLSLFDNRVALATEGLQPYFEKMLREKGFKAKRSCHIRIH